MLLQVPAFHIDGGHGGEVRPPPPAVSASNSIKTVSSTSSIGLHVTDLKSMSPRQRVFNELVQTETNFVNVLKTILHVFKRPLDDPNPIGGQLLNQTELVCFELFLATSTKYSYQRATSDGFK